jgi:hypothetical protein
MRESAYAVKMPMTNAISVVAPPTIRLLPTARRKLLPFAVDNAFSKFSHVTCVGHGVVSKV